jgi:DNA-directed RNA polymerase specialized sigma24 family protein
VPPPSYTVALTAAFDATAGSTQHRHQAISTSGGLQLRIGDIALAIASLRGRCVMTTTTPRRRPAVLQDIVAISDGSPRLRGDLARRSAGRAGWPPVAAKSDAPGISRLKRLSPRNLNASISVANAVATSRRRAAEKGGPRGQNHGAWTSRRARRKVKSTEATSGKLDPMVVPATETTDEALAALAAAGDADAFEAIVARYQSRVFGLAGRLAGHPDDAPDVLQETFLQVHRHLRSFRGDSKFGTWLYRIATNAALMHRRARARRPAESLEMFLPEFDAMPPSGRRPNCGWLAGLTFSTFDSFWPTKRGAIGLLRCIGRRSCCATSSCRQLRWPGVLNVQPAAVRQRVHRARLMLRGYLSALVGATS